MQPENTSSLAAFLESLGTAANPEKEIITRLVVQIRDNQPELAEAIQYCAIPRRFDAEIIGVLRQAPEDREMNERLLERVLSFSFVRTRTGGFYAYDDSTRDALLEDWSENRQEQFDLLNQYLVAYYQKRYERTKVLARDLVAVAPIVGKANSNRYLQLASAAETRLVAPLLEALYHETLRSAEAGYNLFQQCFLDYESKRRLTICDSLLTATRSYLERLPPHSGRGKWLKWIQYWKARLERELRRSKEAERLLFELLRQLDQTPKTKANEYTQLRLWTLSELGLALQEQSKLKEASDKYLGAVTLAEKTLEDPYNLPVWYYRLAGLHFSLDENDQAVLWYQKAIASAKDKNLYLAVHSRLDLSAALFASGRQKEASTAALEALHIARTRLADDKSVHRFVNQQFMTIVARHEPPVLDTLFSEGKSLLAELGDSVASFEFRLHYVAQLRQGGQLKRAEQEFLELERLEGNDKQAKPGLLLEKALIRDEQGRQLEVVESYDELAHKATEDENVWHYAAALSNRGMANYKLARWKAAESDLQAAISHWEKVGYEKLAAFVRIPLAAVFRKRGEISRAEEMLRIVADKLGEGNTLYIAEYHDEYADLLRDQALTNKARSQYEKSLKIIQSFEQREQAARIRLDLAGLAADEGAWEEAREHTNKALKLWQELAAFDHYRPTSDAEKADQINAKGALLFLSEAKDRRELVEQAASEFRKACELVPENCWYQLNRAYACAELADWSEAVKASEAALKSAPASLASSVLYERLAQYRASQGEKLFVSGNYGAAADFYAESKNHLAKKVPLEQQAIFWFRLGDSFLKLGDSHKAEAEYREGLQQLESSDFWALKASFHSRLGFTVALRDELDEAVSNFQASIENRSKAKSDSVVNDLQELVKDFSDSITSISQYQTFSFALQRIIDHTVLEIPQQQKLSAARFDFIRKQYHLIRRSAEPSTDAEGSADVVSAPKVVIEADAQLFPQDEEIPQVKRMIEIDVPSMQEFFYKVMGVKIPGIVIRASESLPPNYYELSLNDTPLANGYAFPEKTFCLDLAKCRKLQIEGDPITLPDGLRGLWLTESNSKRAEAEGLMLLNAYQYMVHHLQLHLRQNLPVFLGIQEVFAMFDQWAQDGSDDSRRLQKGVTIAIPTFIRLAEVVQKLAAEQVPVRNLDVIIRTFVEVNSSEQEVASIVEHVRLALKSELSWTPGTQPIALTESSEAAIHEWVVERENKKFLAIPREDANKVLDGLTRTLTDRELDKLSLIVQTPGLRRFVRRLVEREFPLLPVFAKAELDGMPLRSEKTELIDLVSTA